jgi:hypothetical protein
MQGKSSRILCDVDLTSGATRWVTSQQRRATRSVTGAGVHARSRQQIPVAAWREVWHERGQRQRLHQHVTILGWVYIIGNALLLMVAGFVFVVLTTVGLAIPDPVARSILPSSGQRSVCYWRRLHCPGLRPATDW